MRKIRFFFSKKDRAKYISHLDLIRCMERSIRRGGLTVKMTGGFNPHIYMTFALPLSLGIEGECETMDTEIPEEIELSDAADMLNQGLPADIRVIRAAEPILDHKEISSAEYEAVTDIDGEKLKAFFNSEKIITEKKTKKGMAEIDIKPLITVVSLDGGNAVLRLPAGTELNINPYLVFGAYEKLSGEKASISVKRTKIFCKNGEIFQ